MPKEIADEIAAMFEESEEVETPEGSVAEGVAPDAGGQVPEGDAAPVVEQKPEAEPEWKADFTKLMEQNNKLQEQISALMSGKTKEPEKDAEEAEPTAAKELELVTAEEFDKVISGDVGVLNTLLNRAVQKGFEQAMLAVPEAVQRRVETSIDSKTQVKMYFNENPDLVPHSKFIGIIAQEIVQARPELANNAAALLEEAGKDMRKRFNLTKPSTAPTAPPVPGQKPPTDVGGRQPAPNLKPKPKVESNDIAAQIAAQFDDA